MEMTAVSMCDAYAGDIETDISAALLPDVVVHDLWTEDPRPG